MDLINNAKKVDNKDEKIKKMLKVAIIILVLLSIFIIASIGFLYKQEKEKLKINVDKVDKANVMKDLFVFEGDKIYIPIKRFAKMVGYEVYDGEYKQNYYEDKTKCYIKNNNEVTSFILGSNQIYKKLLIQDENSDYEYFELEEPVKELNGELYTTVEGISRGCNIVFNYSKERNQIDIYTLDKLVQEYSNSNTFKNISAIGGENADFNNQKALLYNMIVVMNAEKKYGVYDLKGQTRIGMKYKNLKFVESSKVFIVETDDNKFGIISYDAIPIITPEYDNIKQISNDLYLVTTNKKMGIINKKGEIVVYPEYDQIGVDGLKYTNIENQYLILNNYIPVMQDKKWGIYNTEGKMILPLEYEQIGCTEKHKVIANEVVGIPKYELIIAKKNGLYGIVDKTGKIVIPFSLKSVYSVTSSGNEKYYMSHNGQEIDVELYYEKKFLQN